MASKSYAKGRRFEWEIRDWFEAKGFFVVRQASSSFPDLIVAKPTEKGKTVVYAVECKHRKNLSKGEKKGLVELNKKYNFVPLMVYKIKNPDDGRKVLYNFWEVTGTGRNPYKKYTKLGNK